MQQVNQTMIQQLLDEGRVSDRKRAFHVFHNPNDAFNRMLIAGVCGSYATPHRHITKFEVFTYVMGDMIVLEFNDDGSIKNAYELSTCPYVEIPPMTWHAVVFASETWAFMEMALWPDSYDPADKEFAPWAPQEFDPEVPAYVDSLIEHSRHLLAQDKTV